MVDGLIFPFLSHPFTTWNPGKLFSLTALETLTFREQRNVQHRLSLDTTAEMFKMITEYELNNAKVQHFRGSVQLSIISFDHSMN